MAVPDESDWEIFQTWCAVVGLRPLPATPHTVALFIAAEAKQGIAPSTLGMRLAAIRLMHIGAHVPSPQDAIEVDEVMRGIRRKWKRSSAQRESTPIRPVRPGNRMDGEPS